jgi:hypothetical protein
MGFSHIPVISDAFLEQSQQNFPDSCRVFCFIRFEKYFVLPKLHKVLRKQLLTTANCRHHL